MQERKTWRIVLQKIIDKQKTFLQKKQRNLISYGEETEDTLKIQKETAGAGTETQVMEKRGRKRFCRGSFSAES